MRQVTWTDGSGRGAADNSNWSAKAQSAGRQLAWCSSGLGLCSLLVAAFVSGCGSGVSVTQDAWKQVVIQVYKDSATIDTASATLVGQLGAAQGTISPELRAQFQKQCIDRWQELLGRLEAAGIPDGPPKQTVDQLVAQLKAEQEAHRKLLEESKDGVVTVPMFDRFRASMKAAIALLAPDDLGPVLSK